MANLLKDIQCVDFDTRPPMLDRTNFTSWKQRIRLYYRDKENRVNILKSIDEGPFQIGTVQETLDEGTQGAPHLGPERPRVYSDLSLKEKDSSGLVQNSISPTPYVLPSKKDYEILFQQLFDEYFNPPPRAVSPALAAVVAPRVVDPTGLPSSTTIDQDVPSARLPKNIYTLINHYTDAKDIWDNVKMLLEGLELTKEDQESQLYDDFEHFRQHEGETIHDYYVRWSAILMRFTMATYTCFNVWSVRRRLVDKDTCAAKVQSHLRQDRLC
nr:retrovirus-related Pol polyprotein from transposon TNT 1-94 [Tanacetum cinerariifolium]